MYSSVFLHLKEFCCFWKKELSNLSIKENHLIGPTQYITYNYCNEMEVFHFISKMLFLYGNKNLFSGSFPIILDRYACRSGLNVQ
jgi:hypothetical protein